MKNPTPEIVKAFWDYMLEAFDGDVVQKATSRQMKAVGWFLDAMKIMDREKFMDRYTTTLCHTIYAPFEIGVPRKDGRYNLWNQMTVLVHECQHIFQFDYGGFGGFALDYAFNKQSRASFEADAWRCDIEMHVWRYGDVPNIEKYAQRIKAYGCGDGEVEYIANFLAMSIDPIREGAIVSDAAQVAIPWLEKHAAELRG